MLYHILPATEWKSASSASHYSPESFDAIGFIHCCTAEQLEYVSDRHFAGRQDLLILCIDESRVTAPIEFEDLSGEGMLFPHVYGPINTDAVKNVVPHNSMVIKTLLGSST